jgi:hypothetical protein
MKQPMAIFETKTCSRNKSHEFITSSRSWKTWKVVEFDYFNIQVWISWKIIFSHGKPKEADQALSWKNKNREFNFCLKNIISKLSLRFGISPYIVSIYA